MTLREKIKTYTTHGGAWKHLEEELIIYGMSEKFSKCYVSRISKSLGYERARKALIVFDDWEQDRDEKKAEFLLLLLSL